MTLRRLVTLRQALSDKHYFGGQLAGESWRVWRSLMYAIMGEPLEPDELSDFEMVTGPISARRAFFPKISTICPSLASKAPRRKGRGGICLLTPMIGARRLHGDRRRPG
jgi:hypothetical protein